VLTGLIAADLIEVRNAGPAGSALASAGHRTVDEPRATIIAPVTREGRAVASLVATRAMPFSRRERRIAHAFASSIAPLCDVRKPTSRGSAGRASPQGCDLSG
jgi:hypothetical protein